MSEPIPHSRYRGAETPEERWMAAFRRVADQLDKWAVASRRGGWSTHQVGPMNRLAAEIRRSAALDEPGDILAGGAK